MNVVFGKEEVSIKDELTESTWEYSAMYRFWRMMESKLVGRFFFISWSSDVWDFSTEFQSRIRRSFAVQLAKKHRLKLFVPDHDSSTERFELFVNELIVQLRRKLAKQDEEISTNKKKCSDSVNPLLVQRNQLKTDLDDFETVDKSQNVHRLQGIIERVEYMEMFNTTVNDESSDPPVPSQTIQLNPMKTNLVQTNSVCHYRVKHFCRLLVSSQIEYSDRNFA